MTEKRIPKQKVMRNWVLNNQFFQSKGYFSKSAFIAMVTWFIVLLKYAFSGLSWSYARAATTIAGFPIPASTITYVVKFDATEAGTLLTIVFGLYFGKRFSNRSSDEDNSVKVDLKDK